MSEARTSEQCIWTLETGPSWYLQSGCGRRGGNVGAINTGGWKVCPYCGKQYAYAGRMANPTADQKADIVFTMGNGMRRFEVWDGQDHIRILISETNQPHEWFYLDLGEAVQVENYLANWIRYVWRMKQ